MYIRDLIPWNFAELAAAVPIGVWPQNILSSHSLTTNLVLTFAVNLFITNKILLFSILKVLKC